MTAAQSCPAAIALPRAGRLHPFSLIRQAGVSAACLQRLERYRRKRERQGAAVLLLSWPDGTWCVLALHAGHLRAVLLSDEQKADAYRQASELTNVNRLPLLAIRFDSHA
ncbi:MAG: hypothetical protein Q8R10_03775 [Pseudomonas sp.]|uniref:hypothetical protein n=1 Tax=Pseudomonas sp. TaxID=306 RepID=UPI002734ADD1|nr:hypothetical protein [Pseudomonas sp.]MDP3845526.1 hypothetical protein [Pseudomonas sp.]